ncbi:hypothetical protein JQC92_07650 [Shewanella sp. 202IG2-18]|uniref:hypothetical protein n=1 Tax=Parashewanella hymeniacidonis TaxID=2807618 RepID=UPI001960C05A|nr:hypothetical protein [Parashewanella hymeniacidonis]MBM7071910.1 hypothetical protein [Parashewanella hymeniacidonis]
MIAVLTADLVNSTKLEPENLVKVTTWLQDYFVQNLMATQTLSAIYRGDEFQLIFKKPQQALYETLLLKLKLKLAFSWNQDCTMSLAYGHADIITDGPQTSQGPVFVSSGRNLSKTKKGDLFISFPFKSSDTYLLLIKLINHQLEKLTRSQVELLTIYLENRFPEHKELAQITDTSRQNISNRLSAIGADLIKEFIQLDDHT